MQITASAAQSSAMLRIVRAVARVQAARPCVAAVRSAHVVALPARLAAVAARPLAAARPGVAGVQWGGFRSTALAAADGDAPSRDQERSNQLFCGNLPFSVDSAQLTNLFADYGCSDAKVVYDQQSGRSKGIAFLTFASEAQAVKAQAAMNGTEIDGRNLRVETRQAPGERKPYEPRAGGGEMRPRRPQVNDDRKLFVGNLAWAVDGLDLEDIFKEFGTVESAQVINDRETGRSRGFGFVIMSTKEESAAAAAELGGANIDGRKIVVEFASEKAKAA